MLVAPMPEMPPRSPPPAAGQPARRRVICLGNDIAGDDGVGLAVGRALASAALPAGVEVELAGCLELEFIDTLRAGDALLLVDAVEMGEAAGTCRLVALDPDSLPAGQQATPAHGLALGRLLELGRRLRPDAMPRRLDLLGIQPARLDRFDDALSPAVAAAVPRAVERCLRWVGVTEEES